MLYRGVSLPTGLRWLRETQINAHLQNTCVQRAKVCEEGRYHRFPICNKARHSAANVRSIRLPTVEVDKFTKQPTYNIHKSINNKGTWQQCKHTESELPRSWCQESTSAEFRDWVRTQLTEKTLSLGITYTIRQYIKQSYTRTRRNYRHRRQILGGWESGVGVMEEKIKIPVGRRHFSSRQRQRLRKAWINNGKLSDLS